MDHEHEHNHACDGCCDHCHAHEEEENASRVSIILLAVAAFLAVICFFPFGNLIKTIFGISAVVLSAYPIVFDIFKDIRHFSLSETELMFIAIVAACFLGEFREAAFVAVLYRVGEILEDKAIARSRRDIEAVTQIQQDYANLVKDDGTTEKVHAEDVKIGSKIQVLPYERFPIDGIIFDGSSTADTSAITGESLPVDISRGSQVKSGMVNGKNAITMYTTENFGNSTASRIIRMVEEASEKKGKTQKTITRIAGIYTPVVVGIAVLLAVIPSIITKNPAEWINRALVFLVASCPCSLVISIPLGFYAGLGAAAKKGIIVKGTAFAEIFAHAKAVVFDKTGTLTTDTFEIKSVHPCEGFSREQVLALASMAEHFSCHPIAATITAASPEADESLIKDFSETAGNGTSVTFAGRRIYCGNKKLLEKNGIDTSVLADNEICVGMENIPVGTIELQSTLRNGAVEMIKSLKSEGIEKTIMLTGDNETSAKIVADECELDEYYSSLLPQDKLTKLEQIKEQYGKTVYIGDGINDAPVLTAADAGIAMGMGTQAANEAADIILTNNDLNKLAPAHKLFKKTVAAMKFNIAFSVAIKLLVFVLGALGLAPIWLAVFADVGVCLICVGVASLIGFDKE